MARFPAPTEGILLTHFIVSRDIERARRFYVEVLGGQALLTGEPTIVALANGWITISTGGEPTIRCYMRDPDGHLIEVGQLVRQPPS